MICFFLGLFFTIIGGILLGFVIGAGLTIPVVFSFIFLHLPIVKLAIIETFTKVRYLKRELVKLHNEKESENSNSMIKRFGDTLSELVMP